AGVPLSQLGPASLHLDWDKIRAIYAVHAVEVTVLPLADSVDLVHDLAMEGDLPINSRERVSPDMVGNSVAVHDANRFDRLSQHLQGFIIFANFPNGRHLSR